MCANPQKEDGHIDIANEIAEALAKINLNKYESRYLWALWRKTYGWHKKSDIISNSQFVELTGIKKQHIWRTQRRLIQRNIVTQIGNQLAFHKDYTTWNELPKQVTNKKVTQIGIPVTYSGIKVTQIGGHKRNYTKETITKETTILSPAGDGINKVFEIFYKTINPTINFGNKTQRKAIEELWNKFGLEKVIKMAQYAISVQGEKYAPTITTPCQLKEKYPALISFFKKNNQSKTIKI